MIAAWIGFNFGLTATGHNPPDPPPFDWLQGVCSAGALLMATIVLTTQNRQRKLTDERA